jgi:hypothetical protein
MNPKQSVKKLEGHNEHLLTYFLSISRKYELIRPMLSSNELVNRYGNGAAGQGFHILRLNMFLGIIQDLAKIIFDDSKKTPSIKKIIETLGAEPVTRQLKENYVSAYYGEDLPQEVKDQFSDERSNKFEDYIKRIGELYKDIIYSGEAELCRVTRDKYTAHLELRYVNGEYHYPQISDFDLSWDMADQLLVDIKELVSLLTMVIRDADFAWDSFEYQNKKIADKFWAI